MGVIQSLDIPISKWFTKLFVSIDNLVVKFLSSNYVYFFLFSWQWTLFLDLDIESSIC